MPGKKSSCRFWAQIDSEMFSFFSLIQAGQHGISRALKKNGDIPSLVLREEYMHFQPLLNHSFLPIILGESYSKLLS